MTPGAGPSIITSFVPRYVKLYIGVYKGMVGWERQKPYGSKMEKFDVVGRK